MPVARKPRATKKASGNGATQPEMTQSSSKPVSSVFNGDFEEQVRRRAYEIYESQGRPHGRDQEHWQQAEAEVRGRTRTA